MRSIESSSTPHKHRWMMRSTISRATIVVALLAAANARAQTISSATDQSFTILDAPAAVAVITVTDELASPTITALNDIRIRIPVGVDMTWDTTVLSVTVGGSAAAKVSATLLAYEDSDKTVVLDVTTDFAIGDQITISGLRFASFTNGSTGLLELEVGNDGGVDAADDKSVTIVEPSLSSASDQGFIVGSPPTASALITITEDALGGSVKASDDIRIRIPGSLAMLWDSGVGSVTLGGSESANVSGTVFAYENGDKTVVLDVISDFSAGGQLTISGLVFSTFTTSSVGSLELELRNNGLVHAVDDRVLSTMSPTIASADDHAFNADDAPTPINTITVNDDIVVASITSANDIRIRIPATFNMTWDTSDTTATFGDTASGKVSATVSYEDAGQTLVVNVTTDFAAGDRLTISGLSFANFAISATDNLELEVGNDGAVTAVDIQTITVIEQYGLTSTGNQVFRAGDPTTAALLITVTDDLTTPTITKERDIRLRIPTGFNMIWDTSVAVVAIGGGAAAKVSTTLRPYEDGGRTAVLDVGTDFVAGDQITVSGLAFANFTAVSPLDNLEIDIDDNGSADGFDDKTILIIAPSISSAANQTFTVGDADTPISTITVTDSGVLPTIAAGEDFRIRIPAGFNMTWDTGDTTATIGGGAAAKVDTTVSYEDAGRTLVLDVTSDFAASDQITISDLNFSSFSAASAPDNLELVVSGTGGGTTATDDKTKAIYTPSSISSAANQIFNQDGPTTAISVITFTEGGTPTTTTTDDLRIRIPVGFNMTWDTADTTAAYGGTASGKVSTTVSYEDAGRTLVVPVTTNFAASDVLTISGLSFANFTAPSTGSLEVDVDADGTGDGVDDKTLTIGPVLTTTGADSVGVGQLYTLNLSASGPVTSWTIDWGDGTLETIAGNPSSVTHTYTRVGFTFDILASAVFAGTTFLQSELLVTSRTGDVKRYESTTGRFLQSIGASELDSPQDVIVGPDGNIYVTDNQGPGSDNVFRYDASGSFIDVLVPGRRGLEVPEGMAFGPTGILYVAGWNTDSVVRYDTTTGALLGTFVSPGSGGLDAANYILFGPDGHLYVSSTLNDAILRYDGATGSFIDSFVAAGSGGLDGPEGFAWGRDGQLYVASGQTNQVLRYNGATGTFIDVFVTAGSAGLAFPVAVDFGADGHLYVSSGNSDEVLRYDGTTGAPIDAYVAAAAGALDTPYYMSFVPGHRVAVTAIDPGPTLSSAANQSFEAEDPPVPAATVTVADHVGVPRVTAANDLRIRIPPAFNMTWDSTVSTVSLGGAAAPKVATTLLGYEDGNQTAVIDVVADFAAGEDVTITGLRFTNFAAVSAADYLSLEVDNDGATTATDDKLITITANNAPRLSSATDQVFVVGSPSTPTATITIAESAFTGWITKKKELRVRIPAGFNMKWDPDITTITVGGPGNVATKLRGYEDGNKTAVIDVVQDFNPGEQVTIDGLQFETFTTVSAVDNLELEVFNDGGVTDTDDRTVEVIADTIARIVSEKDQLFWEDDPPTPAEAIYITEASVASINAKNDLRIRIPASLAMAWDSSVTSVGVTGTGAAKVGTAVSYEDANRTLVIDVTANFASADHIRVSGTAFAGFVESPTGYLELEVSNDDLVTSTDSSSITIDPESKVRVFTAKSTSGENRLEWLNPKSGSYVSTRIVAKDGSPPANRFDGRLVVDQAGGLGATDWFADTGLVDGITVHYAAYVDQGGGSFSEVARTTGRPFDHITGSVRWAFSTGATTMVAPSIRFLAGVPTVYVVSNTNVFYAMEGDTGGGAWPVGWKPVEFGAPSQSRPPVVPFGIGSASNGAALVGSQDGSVYVIDADTGTTVWKSAIAEKVQAAPAGEFTAYANGDTDLVLVGTRNTLAPNAVNALFALKVGDGMPAWNFRNLSSQGGDDLRMGSVSGGVSIDYVNNRVYFASQQGSPGTPGPSLNTLWCVSFDGVAPTLEWARNIGDVDGSPILYNGTIYVGTVAGDVYAFDTAGTEVWRNTTLGDGAVKGFVFPIFGTSNVLLSTNTKVWSLDMNGIPNTGWPVTLSSPSTPVYSWGLDAVFVGGGDSKLHQINLANPGSVSSATLGDGVAAVTGAPTLDRKNSLIYVGTERGVVYAVEFPIP